MSAPPELAAMDTPWYTPGITVPVNDPPMVVAYERIDAMADLKVYSLRNGLPEDVEPYLLTSAIPPVHHWVPMNGLAPRNAMRCTDGFIKSYMYRIASLTPADMPEALRRKAAIILGTCRAVMTTNYELTSADINAQELAGPVLSVTLNAEGTPAYTPLVASNAAGADLLTGPLNLSNDEVAIVRVISRCAQTIIPLQGLNLISDGHHYLSEKSKASYKSFLAVERQVWMPRAFKEWIAGIEDAVRDIMWHKAGHPVAVAFKESAASDPRVKEVLEAAKLGSAAARLPALEADLRAADTYLKLSESVGAIWSTTGGSVDCESLRFRIAAVKSLPRDSQVYNPPINMGEGVFASTRAVAISILKTTVTLNTEKAAVLYGFYCSMLDSGANDMVAGSTDTLRSAYSLKKLRSNNIASYLIGTEMYKDYRAMRSAARKAADKKMPAYSLDW